MLPQRTQNDREQTDFMKTNFLFLNPKTSKIDSFQKNEVPHHHSEKNKTQLTQCLCSKIISGRGGEYTKD